MTVEDSDISRLEAHLVRIESKIDAQEQKFVSRMEYEARHAALENDFKRLELEQRGRLDKQEQQIEGLRTQVASNSTALWKEVALTLMGLLLGGGVIGVLNYLHVLFPGH